MKKEIDENLTEKDLRIHMGKLEKRFNNYMKIEEEHFDEFNQLKQDFREFSVNFHFIMSARRTWFGKLVMWLLFKGKIEDTKDKS